MALGFGRNLRGDIDRFVFPGNPLELSKLLQMPDFGVVWPGSSRLGVQLGQHSNHHLRPNCRRMDSMRAGQVQPFAWNTGDQSQLVPVRIPGSLTHAPGTGAAGFRYAEPIDQAFLPSEHLRNVLPDGGAMFETMARAAPGNEHPLAVWIPIHDKVSGICVLVLADSRFQQRTVRKFGESVTEVLARLLQN